MDIQGDYRTHEIRSSSDVPESTRILTPISREICGQGTEQPKSLCVTHSQVTVRHAGQGAQSSRGRFHSRFGRFRAPCTTRTT